MMVTIVNLGEQLSKIPWPDLVQSMPNQFDLPLETCELSLCPISDHFECSVGTCALCTMGDIL